MDPNDKPPAGRRVIIGKLDSLIAASSLGTPGALALRAAADPEEVEKILARAAKLDADCDWIEDQVEMDAEWLSHLEGSLEAEEAKALMPAEARHWWRRSRAAWGRLQQVRKGTRVRCPFCAGARVGCPMCERGFVDRDAALMHYETDMDFACK